MPQESLLEQFSRDLASVHRSVAPSLVQVRRSGRGIGAGSIWSADGLILTNAHVIEDTASRGRRRVSGDLTIRLHDGRMFPVRVLAVDRRSDLALLHAPAADLVPLALGDSQLLAPGALVMAFGFPYGIDDGATVGAVIAVGQGVTEGSAVREQEWLAAALHLRPGHSGGPMVDAQARLVGVNTMMNGPDVGVAVPVHVAKRFVAQARAGATPYVAHAPVWV